MPLIETPGGLFIAFFAGLVAAGINAFAGGGSLVSFPTLIALGMPGLSANATNSVALWPGSFAAAMGFREKLPATKHYLKALLLPTIVGSILGAILLVSTSEKVFGWIVPFLILGATLLLAFQKQIKEAVESGRISGSPRLGAVLQFFVSIYGGYFGAGMGIMMLAVMGLFVKGDLHEMNAIKSWLAVVINFGASVCLVAMGLVHFAPALALMAGALIGGYLSARLSLKVPTETLRKVIVAYGALMTVWFFIRGFLT
ncbi:MAG: sulfite exporter TauE/SafE family protein [Fimbriimonadaceae bacterium]|jgi:hypothetical protein|nr:sulfite exporter TauE/SafE family protein [Fimbriimonadaceae bacterium]